MTTLYSYVVARDYGFAPNPFFGVCTLATCKPLIRRTAAIGDWIVGTGSQTNYRRGYVVYAMRVSQTLDFNQYWNDPRFKLKKPNLRGSKKQAFGDNIYSKSGRSRSWCQANSHHSFADGTVNRRNVEADTSADRVLLGEEFIYWGRSGPKIPSRFLNFGPRRENVCAVRGHKNHFSPELVRDFVRWIQSQKARGYVGEPLDWDQSP